MLYYLPRIVQYPLLFHVGLHSRHLSVIKILSVTTSLSILNVVIPYKDATPLIILRIVRTQQRFHPLLDWILSTLITNNIVTTNIPNITHVLGIKVSQHFVLCTDMLYKVLHISPIHIIRYLRISQTLFITKIQIQALLLGK